MTGLKTERGLHRFEAASSSLRFDRIAEYYLRGLSSMKHQHRAGGLVQHRVGRAAEHEAGEATASA